MLVLQAPEELDAMLVTGSGLPDAGLGLRHAESAPSGSLPAAPSLPAVSGRTPAPMNMISCAHKHSNHDKSSLEGTLCDHGTPYDAIRACCTRLTLIHCPCGIRQSMGLTKAMSFMRRVCRRGHAWWRQPTAP